MSLILIENVVLLRVATAIENAFYELQCVQLLVILGVRDTLVVLATLKRNSLLIAVLLLIDQVLDILAAFHIF